MDSFRRGTYDCSNSLPFIARRLDPQQYKTLSDFARGGCLMGEMREKPDVELLRDYAERGHEAAFRELVTRYTDLVYSAALRQLESADLAGDITQGVFLDLARKARPVSERLAAHNSLAGWLHRSARYAVLNHLRDTRRRVSNERQAMEQLLHNSDPSVDWEQIRPALDEALDSLGDEDREVLLLRYFKNYDLRTVGAALGVSDDAAQKRVSRAVERLREFFSKRGVSIGAGGLVAVVSANAVQAAPVGLAVAISTAAALAGTTLATTAAATATKAIAMTTLQKIIVGVTLVAAVGVGVYQTQQATRLRDQVQILHQQQAPPSKQIADFNQALIEATNQVAGLHDANERLNRSTAELLKLRGEIGVLRRQLADGGNAKTRIEQLPLSSATEYYRRAERHRSENEYEAQFEDLNKAIELDPNLADAYKDRASLYAQNLPKSYGGYAKAVADYTRYLELKPKDAPIRHNRGLYCERLGQFDNSIADYTMVIEGDLDFEQQLEGKNKLIALDYMYRGRIYHWQKRDYAKAIADYTAALALDPQREGAHRLRGQAYESIGEFEKAQQDFAIEPKN